MITANDGGSEFPAKQLAKAELYRFLGVPKSDPSNTRDGVYRAQYGTGERTVKVILLDTRWFRGPLERTSGSNSKYLANKTGTLLGVAQWRWLKKSQRQYGGRNCNCQFDTAIGSRTPLREMGEFSE